MFGPGEYFESEFEYLPESRINVIENLISYAEIEKHYLKDFGYL